MNLDNISCFFRSLVVCGDEWNGKWKKNFVILKWGGMHQFSGDLVALYYPFLCGTISNHGLTLTRVSRLHRYIPAWWTTPGFEGGPKHFRKLSVSWETICLIFSVRAFKSSSYRFSWALAYLTISSNRLRFLSCEYSWEAIFTASSSVFVEINVKTNFQIFSAPHKHFKQKRIFFNVLQDHGDKIASQLILPFSEHEWRRGSSSWTTDMYMSRSKQNVLLTAQWCQTILIIRNSKNIVFGCFPYWMLVLYVLCYIKPNSKS